MIYNDFIKITNADNNFVILYLLYNTLPSKLVSLNKNKNVYQFIS